MNSLGELSFRWIWPCFSHVCCNMMQLCCLETIINCLQSIITIASIGLHSLRRFATKNSPCTDVWVPTCVDSLLLQQNLAQGLPKVQVSPCRCCMSMLNKTSHMLDYESFEELWWGIWPHVRSICCIMMELCCFETGINTHRLRLVVHLKEGITLRSHSC